MSTTVGNGLTVDGTVKASQATQAGEAVVLGEDGLIPASLLPSTGGEQWEEIPYNSTMISGGIYKVRCPLGSAEFVNFPINGYQSVHFPYPGTTGAYIDITDNIISKCNRGSTNIKLSSSTIKLYRLIS